MSRFVMHPPPRVSGDRGTHVTETVGSPAMRSPPRVRSMSHVDSFDQAKSGPLWLSTSSAPAPLAAVAASSGKYEVSLLWAA